MPVYPFWNPFCRALSHWLWCPRYLQCDQVPLPLNVTPLFRSTFLNASTYEQLGHVVQDPRQLDDFTQRLYAAASYATPAQGAPLDLPFKKRGRDAEAPAPEQKGPFKTESYLLVLTTEQKKGKFEFKIISSLSRLSLLLNALPHEMFIHSSHLFTSHLFSSHLFISHLFSSPLPFFTNDSFTAVQLMLYLRMFLYNLIVRAYNSGEVQLKNMQLEFSTSCSPIFQIHGKLLKLPTNSATGRLP